METIRYADSDLQEFKDLIDNKLEKALKELDYLQEQILEITENTDGDFGGDWMDDSTTTNDIEMLNNMAIRQRKYIRELENALLRIQNKTYGICMISGELIDKKRLLAVPTATKSLQAKLAEKEVPERKVTRTAGEGREEGAASGSSSDRKPKVITKIIRKSAAPKPARDLDDEFDEIFGKDDDDIDTNDDIDNDDVDLDEIPDEDTFD
jgi:RNA polymerase-binding transcription factor DksA